MSFKYFRFYLSESEFYDEKELVEVLKQFGARKDLGFIRASFDLMSTDKSISILCESDADIEIEKESWRIFLREKNINLKENIVFDKIKKWTKTLINILSFLHTYN